MIQLTSERTCVGQTPNFSAPSLGSYSIKPTWIQVVVTQKRREATDIYSFHLAKPEGDVLPSFAAGAHIDVEVAPGLVRQYSLCNSSDATDHYEIALLRENASRGGSQTMADTINVGATLRISEPRNHFQLARDAKRSVLIAGGIGVTPLLSMAKWRRLSRVRCFRAHRRGDMFHLCGRNQRKIAGAGFAIEGPRDG
jgi:vanillate monooxygenase ferredoxin subunit